MPTRYIPPRVTPATLIVPDATLDALGDAFLAHGGAKVLRSFERFVLGYRPGTDPLVYARARQRAALDNQSPYRPHRKAQQETLA